jgi:hypothetical protein
MGMEVEVVGGIGELMAGGVGSCHFVLHCRHDRG